ncbi:hypothetical protein [Halomonas sp. I5-271120]|uniref:hypothetical protein n=1 Tax=Halomonas sp. I5-271120 TaxID=3061632 RepID=UPI00271460CE|nr:hypothetical protein [Halomonas sp. I5-271120]
MDVFNDGLKLDVCNRHVDMMLSNAGYSLSVVELEFSEDEDEASPTIGQPHVLSTIYIEDIEVSFQTTTFRERLLRDNNDSMLDRVYNKRLFYALNNYERTLGSPVFVMDPKSRSNIRQNQQAIHLMWQDPCQDVIDAFPSNREAVSGFDAARPFVQAMCSLPSAPKKVDPDNLKVAIKNFRNMIYDLCVAQVRKDLTLIWNSTLELSRNFLPYEKEWPELTCEGRFKVRTYSVLKAPSFEEVPDVPTELRLRLARGEGEFHRLESHVVDTVTGKETSFRHGFHEIPKEFGGGAKVIRQLTIDAVKHLKEEAIAA